MLRRRNDTTNKRLQQGVYSFGQSSVFIHCKVDKNSDDFKSVVQQLVRCEGRYRTSLPSPFSSDARPVDLIVADFRIHTQGDLLQICQDFLVDFSVVRVYSLPPVILALGASGA